MKKFFKSLAVVLALALVITSVPATAASAASVSLKSKTVTLYSEPSTGKTEDGKVCKSYDFWKIAKLLNNFDAETMDIKLVSEDTDLVQKSNKKDMIWVADGASFGTTKVKVIVTSLSTEKVLLEKSITVKVKKNATEDTFKCDLENGSEFEVGETVAVTLSRKNTDTDARKLTCADDSVEIVDANGYGTKYNVTFTKAGKFTLVASAYQSAKYPAPTVEKEIEVVVTSDFAASATGAREITVVGSSLTKDITVKRNNVTVSADDVKVSDDKTTAVITLASKITDATYVVTFGEQTAEFVGEKQRVEKIVLLDDGKYVTTKTDNTNQEIYVHYDVLDQYGDSVRANTEITWSVSADSDPDKDLKEGLITIKVDKNNALHYGSTIVITGTYAGNGIAKSVTGQVYVGLERNVNSIELVSLVRRDGTKVDVIPADFNAGEYGFVYKMFDQDGYPMDYTDELDDALTFSSQSTLLVQQLTKGPSKIIDGVEYGYVWLTPGVNAAKGGVAEILVISTKTGKQTPIAVEVGSLQVVDNFTFFAPDCYVRGDGEVTLEFEAYDTDGNKVTNYHALINSVSFSNNHFKFRKQNDGSALLRYNGSATTPTENFVYPDTCVVILSNGTTVNKTVDVHYNKKLAAVKGFESWVSTNIVEGDTFEIRDWNFSCIDNYDRVYGAGNLNDTDILTMDVDNGFGVDYTVKVNSATMAPNEDGLILFTKNDSVDIVAATNVTNSSKDISFVLGVYDTEKNTVLGGSEKTCIVTINDITQCTSFALDGDSHVKYGTDVTELKLVGYLRNGAKVDSIPQEYWVVDDIDDSKDHYTVADSYKVSGAGYNVTASGSAIKSDFLDYSVVKADGSHPGRTQTFEISANVYDYYNPVATGTAIKRDTVKFKVTTGIEDKKDTEIKVAGDNLVVQANGGNITALDLVQAALRNVTDNYSNSFSQDFKPWDSYDTFRSYTGKNDNDDNTDGLFTITISKVAENTNGRLGIDFSIDSNGYNEDGYDTNGDPDVIISGAEMGDTFVVTFTTDHKGSVSVNFTVGADKQAYWTSESSHGIETWF